MEYDVCGRRYTPFSKKLSQHLPLQWMNRPSSVRHVTFDPRHPDVIILHDDSLICTIDKNKVSFLFSFSSFSQRIFNELCF